MFFNTRYQYNHFSGGVNGVFEIEDLISLLQKSNAKNIFVTSVPSELQYVDYVVIVTGRSKKHMQSLANFVRKVYKLKKDKTDFLPKIEGEDSKDWLALDLGNFLIMLGQIYYIFIIIELLYIPLVLRKYCIAYFFKCC